jgi:hypothetical protein
MRRHPCTLWLAACLLPLVTLPPGKAETAAGGADEKLLQAAGVGTDGAALRAYFRKRTLTPAAQKKIDALVGQLGSRSYKIRHRASVRLAARGIVALPALGRALGSADREVVRRAEKAIRRIRQRAPSPEVTAAATRLLARGKPPEAAATLLAFLPFAENDPVAEGVQAALTALAVRDGKPDRALVAGLADSDPVRRAAAAEVLCRAGVGRDRPDVRKLLRDAQPTVRLRAAVALAGAGRKEAVPVLIDLVGRLPLDQAFRAQEFLYRLGETGWPHVRLTADAKARRRCRDAWAGWWKKHGAKMDLARLTRKPKPLGYTMLVLLDEGKVVERDARGKLRWQVEGLEQPLDVQLLPGDRLLVTEHEGNRVTERDLKGRVLWEKKIRGPLVAQRLESGRTLIATREALVEIDRAGHEVWKHAAPGGEMFMRTHRLPGGDTACVTGNRQGASRFFRLSAAGKAGPSFRVNVATFGGRIEVLANGNVLVPEMLYSRVVEYSPRGEYVRQVRVSQPVAAVSLANGHWLVSTYRLNRAIELDKEGTEVHEFKAATRVTRAWRR